MCLTVTRWLFSVGLAIAVLGLSHCTPKSNPEQPMPTRPIEEVLKDHTPTLMALPGVVGTAQGLCEDKDCIKVYVAELTSSLKERIPRTLEGYSVDIEETGPFRALPRQ